MKGRFANVRTKKQVEFIKRRYKEAYQMVIGVMDGLKVGDKVVIHTCLESKRYDGKVWTCRTNQFTAESGTQVVFLEGFRGYLQLSFYNELVC